MTRGMNGERREINLRVGIERRYLWVCVLKE